MLSFTEKEPPCQNTTSECYNAGGYCDVTCDDGDISKPELCKDNCTCCIKG